MTAQPTVNATLVLNALLNRLRTFTPGVDPRRSISDECGHPSGPVDPWTFQDLYETDAISARVVEVWPNGCWQVSPLVYESEDADVVTPFEEAWDHLGRQLRGEGSHHGQEQGSCVWEYLHRADVQSGIGQYGVILLGLDDGRALSEPADLRPAGSNPAGSNGRRGVAGTPRRLLFLRVLPESLAKIVAYDEDPASPRFGCPTAYQLTLNDPRKVGALSVGGASVPTTETSVHWTRVVHVADNLETSEVWGAPRMRAVLSRLLDLRKLYGGSAEMFWKGALPGLSFETHPALGGDVEIDSEALKALVEDYQNGLQRYIATRGLHVNSLAPQVADPSGHIDAQLTAICIKLEVPKRKFMGTERGELASSQDDGDWEDRLRHRQQRHLTPRVICPFVDRLIMLGVLPAPGPGGYRVWWPDLGSQSAQEQASVGLARTEALARYVSGGCESVVSPLDYLTRFLGFDEDEAVSILEAAVDAAQAEAGETEAQEDAERLTQERTEEAGGGRPGAPMAGGYDGQPVGVGR